MAKRTYRGCTCGCGTGTYGNYAPGHDAKHVARLVAYVVEGWAEGFGGEAGVRWGRAIKNLPTEALQNKFRKAMTARAIRERATEISGMQDANWQRQLHLAYMVSGVDQAYAHLIKAGDAAVYLACVAAAMGLSQRAVNYRQS